MNKAPDETTLTLWMDGLLDGEELQNMEVWAQAHPELLAERDAIRTMSQSLQTSIPSSIEPPYPDFFNQRILNAVTEDGANQVTTSAQSKGGLWRWLTIPVAAGAMALCFYLGTQNSALKTNTTQYTTTIIKPTVYTPDSGVEAEIFINAEQNATVIVIEGLQDIPDDLEIAGIPSKDDPNNTLINTQHTF